MLIFNVDEFIQKANVNIGKNKTIIELKCIEIPTNGVTYFVHDKIISLNLI